jgi:iron complex outermembrane recepter protein
MSARRWITSGLCLAGSTLPALAAQPDATAPVQLSTIEVRDSEADDPQAYVRKQANTATKTDTPLIETPHSVVVVPRQVLQDQQALTLDRALANVRGVNSGGGEGGQESITLRGFFTTTTFVNGFRLEEYSTTGGGTLGSQSMGNVDRVEVLLGPAAILYGRVEPGGMVNIITKQPERGFSATVQQQVGSWGHFVTSADVNMALNGSGSLALRVNASYDSTDSWRNTINARSSLLAPVLAWQPTERTRLALEATLRRQTGNQDVGQIVPLDPTTNSLVLIGRESTALYNPTVFDISRYFETLTHEFNADWQVTQRLMRALTVVPTNDSYYPFYGTGLYQQGGQWYVDRSLSTLGSYNRTDAGLVDVTGHFTALGARHTLLVGADYYRTQVDIGFGGGNDVSTSTLLHPTPPSLVADPANDMALPQVSRDYGVHVQDQLRFGGQLDVVVGARYQHYETTTSFEMPPGTPLGDPTLSSDHATTPHAAVLWQFQPHRSVYASYATNFGSNNGLDYQGKALDPESGRQYELGAKAESEDGRVSASVAWFDLRKTNLSVGDQDHPGFSVTVGEVRSRGIEADLQGEIASGWNLMASASYDPTVITHGNATGTRYRTGDPLQGAPEWMANLWSTWRLSGTSANGWKVGAGANWRDRGAWPRATLAGGTLSSPSYWVLSAMVSWARPLGRAQLTAQLNAENLLNAFYYNNLYPVAGSNYSYLNYGAPRSFMGSVKVAF